MSLTRYKMKKDKSLVHQHCAAEKEINPVMIHLRREGVEKSIAHIVAEIIDYIPHSIVSRTIVKRTTGNVTILAYSQGKESVERLSPFESYIQIIEGTASILINDDAYELGKGEGIIVPAHARHCFIANQPFKMISTVIKSGYED
jgi:quercetin dioxygenase-like cupin family protein